LDFRHHARRGLILTFEYERLGQFRRLGIDVRNSSFFEAKTPNMIFAPVLPGFCSTEFVTFLIIESGRVITADTCRVFSVIVARIAAGAGRCQRLGAKAGAPITSEASQARK
jgi:hypothetical protein